MIPLNKPSNHQIEYVAETKDVRMHLLLAFLFSLYNLI